MCRSERAGERYYAVYAWPNVAVGRCVTVSLLMRQAPTAALNIMSQYYFRCMWKLAVVLLVLFASPAIGQESVPALGGASDKVQRVFDQRMPSAGDKRPATTPHDSSDSTIVDEPPSYPGGRNEMLKFIWANIEYPDSARQAGIFGMVYVSFMVETDGNLSEAQVLRGIDSACDKEALRVVSLMPNWVPARSNGEPVRAPVYLPIYFELR
jgi:TonB family protein